MQLKFLQPKNAIQQVVFPTTEGQAWLLLTA
jgi:hypothetical protein